MVVWLSKILAPKAVHILIPMDLCQRTLLPYITIYGKKDFAEVIK